MTCSSHLRPLSGRPVRALHLHVARPHEEWLGGVAHLVRDDLDAVSAGLVAEHQPELAATAARLAARVPVADVPPATPRKKDYSSWREWTRDTEWAIGPIVWIYLEDSYGTAGISSSLEYAISWITTKKEMLTVDSIKNQIQTYNLVNNNDNKNWYLVMKLIEAISNTVLITRNFKVELKPSGDGLFVQASDKVSLV